MSGSDEPDSKTMDQIQKEDQTKQIVVQMSESDEPDSKTMDQIHQIQKEDQTEQIVVQMSESDEPDSKTMDQIHQIQKEDQTEQIVVQMPGSEEPHSKTMDQIHKEDPTEQIVVQMPGSEEPHSKTMDQIHKEDPTEQIVVQMPGSEEPHSKTMDQIHKEDPTEQIVVQMPGRDEPDSKTMDQIQKEDQTKQIVVQMSGSDEPDSKTMDQIPKEDQTEQIVVQMSGSDESKLKTIDQIQREAQAEQIIVQPQSDKLLVYSSLSNNGGDTSNTSATSNTGAHMCVALENADMDKTTTLSESTSTIEEDKQTEELYKKVRSILNKLTPEKFVTLMNQVRQLRIDTKEKLQGVVNLIFEKATNETNLFVCLYAKMCREIQNWRVPAGDEEKSVKFRTLMVERCQQDFEKNAADESGRDVEVKEMKECLDPDKKKELEQDLVEYDRELRMKFVGTIRFKGELFKQNLLKASILLRCVQTLLDNKDEKSLEELCKLVMTVGKALELKKCDLRSIFHEMEQIIEGKRQKITSRLRFMLQNVIDLRDSEWPQVGESLDSLFGNWGKRASARNTQPGLKISMYADLENLDLDRGHYLISETTTTVKLDKETEELCEKLWSILKELTPENLETVVNQIKQLKIDTKEKLQGVVNLVLEKARDEPNHSSVSLYAMLCKEIQNMQMPVGVEKKSVAFRTLLVGRCQQDFEKYESGHHAAKCEVIEIEECTDPDKRKELQEDLEEYNRGLRTKYLGTIRFIGELFHQQMLTASIMRRCLQTLLDTKDEGSLEGVCVLLRTVGKTLELRNIDLSSIFDEMKQIAEGKRQKISSRLRFMLQDIIDLKNSKWVGFANTTTRDDRGAFPRRRANDYGWSSVESYRPPGFSMSRLKMPQADEPLSSRSLFGSWGKPASVARNTQPTSVNIYAGASSEHADMNRRPTSMSSRGSKDSYSSSDSSMEHNSYKNRNSRFGWHTLDRPIGSSAANQHANQQHYSISVAQLRLSKLKEQMERRRPPSSYPMSPSVSKRTEDHLERRIRVALDEWLSGSVKSCEYFQDIAPVLQPSDYSKAVYESFNYTLEKTAARLETGKLFAELIEAGSLSVEDVCKGLEELFSLREDLMIDIPQIHQFFAEDLFYLITKEVLPFSRLHKLLNTLIQENVASKVLKHLFALIIENKEEGFLHVIWKKSGLQLSDFMPASEVQSFSQECNVTFLLCVDSPADPTSAVPYEVIQKKLSEILESNASFDDIVSWISVNVGDRVKEKHFIRTLATAIFENSISKSKLNSDVLSSHAKLIQKYVDADIDNELQCLYALQSLIHKLFHPQGLLLAICDKLYEDSIISQESFIAWESSSDRAEQKGKGVALKQLKSLFIQLKENKEEDEYSSNSEDNA